MILIHVYPGGRFTTQQGGSGMSPWEEHQQAAKYGCETTYVSHRGADRGSFGETFRTLANSYLEIPGVGVAGLWQKRRHTPWPNAQAWQLWASTCISDFGAWFTEVAGPSDAEQLEEMVLRRVRNAGGAMKLCLIKNQIKNHTPEDVEAAVNRLAFKGEVLFLEVRSPRNGVRSKVVSIPS